MKWDFIVLQPDFNKLIQISLISRQSFQGNISI